MKVNQRKVLKTVLRFTLQKERSAFEHVNYFILCFLNFNVFLTDIFLCEENKIKYILLNFRPNMSFYIYLNYRAPSFVDGSI